MNGQERLAEQSRQWLVDALFTLLAEEHYGEITVTALTTQAQLARRTFYRSFASKDDLLAFYGKRLWQRYQTAQQTQLPKQADLNEQIRFFFQFWWPERRHLHLLIRQNLLLGLLAQSPIGPGPTTPIPHTTEPHPTYQQDFILGGLWTTLNTWLAQPQPEAPEVIAQKLIHTLRPRPNRP